MRLDSNHSTAFDSPDAQDDYATAAQMLLSMMTINFDSGGA
jgi:hypothetical protein